MLSALLIPSGVVRILILMPLIVTLLRTLGEPPGSRVSAALILSLACSTYYGGTGVLTASVPSLVVFGVLESRDITVYWGQWTLYLFPVFSLCRVACCYALIRLLLPLRGAARIPSKPHVDADVPDRVTPAEKKTLCILLAGILLWATDALHGIHPAYVGLGLVLACYLPGLGPLHPDLLKKINFPLLIYIAAAFSVGHALETTGFSPLLAYQFTEWLGRFDGNLLTQLGVLSAFILPFNFMADTAAVAAILTPVLLDVAAQTGHGAASRRPLYGHCRKLRILSVPGGAVHPGVQLPIRAYRAVHPAYGSARADLAPVSHSPQLPLLAAHRIDLTISRRRGDGRGKTGEGVFADLFLVNASGKN